MSVTVHCWGPEATLKIDISFQFDFAQELVFFFFSIQNSVKSHFTSSLCLLIRIQNELASNFTSLTKVLYDFNKLLEKDRLHGSPLRKLMINSFDDEQIWQQLELQNEPVLQYFENAVSETIKDGDLSLLPETEEHECEEDGSEVGAAGQEDLEQDMEEGEEASDLSGEDPNQDETARNASRSDLRKSPVFSDEDSDLDFDISKLEQQSKLQNKVPRKPREKSLVDDKFFKLAEMETFLEDMEKEEEQKDDSEEDDIDLFEDVDSDEDEGGLSGRQTLKVKSGRDEKEFFLPSSNQFQFCVSRRGLKTPRNSPGHKGKI